MFGNKEYDTKLLFANDTVSYLKANYSDSTSFGGLFAKLGIQYTLVVSGDKNLRFGATFGLENTMKASRNVTRETFNFSDRGITVLDSIYKVDNQKGEIVSPGNYGFAVMYEKIDNWLVGAEFNYAGWSNYRYFGEADALEK